MGAVGMVQGLVRLVGVIPRYLRVLGPNATVPPEALSRTQDVVTPNLPKSAHTLPLILWIATSPEANSNPTKAQEDWKNPMDLPDSAHLSTPT